MVIGILQPGYLPWLGFFEQLHHSDVFVLYDDVQYDKNGWRNRNRIKTADGIRWLTVPVQASLSGQTLIHQVKIDHNSNWARKHLLSISQSYSKAPFYRDYLPLFEEAYSRQWDHLIDLDLHFISKLAQALGLDTRKLVRSSTIAIEGDTSGRLINICRKFGADIFYEGAAGRDYIDTEAFATAGVTVRFQDYHHPTYRQLHGGFTPYLSVIDLLFNHGPESLSILTLKGAPTS